jgi:uncharacterized protein YjeT (DUF2065 family)
MNSLSMVSLSAGVVAAAGGVACLLGAGTARSALAALPRNRSAGWIITAVVICWSAWLLYHTPLGRFDGLKPLVFIAAPVSIYLLVTFVDELIAARALGALLLLIPSPMLAAVRTSYSYWRWPIGIVAYLLVVAGISLVLSPHLFRKAAGVVAGTDSRCRVTGIVLAVCGVFFTVLSLTAFR